MSTQDRVQREHQFRWEASADSNEVELGSGAFGTLIVPVGSPLIGQTLQFVAVSSNNNFDATELLSAAKTLESGANPLTANEIAEVGAVGRCLLRTGSSVSGQATLLWKS